MPPFFFFFHNLPSPISTYTHGQPARACPSKWISCPNWKYIWFIIFYCFHILVLQSDKTKLKQGNSTVLGKRIETKLSCGQCDLSWLYPKRMVSQVPEPPRTHTFPWWLLPGSPLMSAQNRMENSDREHGWTWTWAWQIVECNPHRETK